MSMQWCYIFLRAYACVIILSLRHVPATGPRLCQHLTIFCWNNCAAIDWHRNKYKQLLNCILYPLNRCLSPLFFLYISSPLVVIANWNQESSMTAVLCVEATAPRVTLSVESTQSTGANGVKSEVCLFVYLFVCSQLLYKWRVTRELVFHLRVLSSHSINTYFTT